MWTFFLKLHISIKYSYCRCIQQPGRRCLHAAQIFPHLVLPMFFSASRPKYKFLLRILFSLTNVTFIFELLIDFSIVTIFTKNRDVKQLIISVKLKFTCNSLFNTCLCPTVLCRAMPTKFQYCLILFLQSCTRKKTYLPYEVPFK